MLVFDFPLHSLPFVVVFFPQKSSTRQDPRLPPTNRHVHRGNCHLQAMQNLYLPRRFCYWTTPTPAYTEFYFPNAKGSSVPCPILSVQLTWLASDSDRVVVQWYNAFRPIPSLKSVAYSLTCGQSISTVTRRNQSERGTHILRAVPTYTPIDRHEFPSRNQHHQCR